MPLAEHIMRFYRYDELKTVGIPFSRVHCDRLQRAGKFPRKIHLGGNTVVYRADEIDAWIDARIAERDDRAT